MANLSAGYSFGSTEQVTNAKLAALINNGVVSHIVDADIDSAAGISLSKINLTAASINYDRLNLTNSIVNADISSSAAIADSKIASISTAGKVSGAALTSLSSTPSGAGQIPIANLATGTPTGNKFVRDDGTLQSPQADYASGTYQIAGPCDIIADASGSYTKIIEMIVPRSGTLTIKFWLRDSAGQLAFGRVYRNGSAVGTERSTSSASLTQFSENISGWTSGDLLQIYGHEAFSNPYHIGAVEIFENIPVRENFGLGGLNNGTSMKVYRGPDTPTAIGVVSGFGSIGDLYTNSAGSTSTTLYVKTASNTWTAK